MPTKTQLKRMVRNAAPSDDSAVAALEAEIDEMKKENIKLKKSLSLARGQITRLKRAAG
jgi:hypothetical protein